MIFSLGIPGPLSEISIRISLFLERSAVLIRIFPSLAVSVDGAAGGIDGIVDDIKKDLLQLRRIAHDLGRSG